MCHVQENRLLEMEFIWHITAGTYFVSGGGVTMMLRVDWARAPATAALGGAPVEKRRRCAAEGGLSSPENGPGEGAESDCAPSSPPAGGHRSRVGVRYTGVRS